MHCCKLAPSRMSSLAKIIMAVKVLSRRETSSRQSLLPSGSSSQTQLAWEVGLNLSRFSTPKKFRIKKKIPCSTMPQNNINLLLLSHTREKKKKKKKKLPQLFPEQQLRCSSSSSCVQKFLPNGIVTSFVKTQS